MDISEELVVCYNKGCGIKFDPQKNSEDKCIYHPGAPVFHDAYKSWSCCNKRSTDFTTFLNMKGCTIGKHNREKPKEPEKVKPDTTTKDEIIIPNPPLHPINQFAQPDFHASMMNLEVIIAPSSKPVLSTKTNDIKEYVDENRDSNFIQIGEPCKHNGCKSKYEGQDSDLEICKYHPGFPIFHEGMKYWICCQRKTSDFDSFLQQEGCESGSHCWSEKAANKSACRYDWHQTPTYVFVTVYTKGVEAELSTFKANSLRFRSQIIFGNNNVFELDLRLGGVINVKESCVTLTATKVEIKLRKSDPRMWHQLYVPLAEEKVAEESDAGCIDTTKQPDSSDNPIDLSDI